MNLIDLITKGYMVIPNFLSNEEVQRLISDYHESATLETNKNHAAISSKKNHNLESKIHPLLQEINKAIKISVDMCLAKSIYFRSKYVNFKWHQDQESYYLTQQSFNTINLWIPLIKPDTKTTGLTIMPFERLNEHRNYFRRHGARSISVIDSDTIRVYDLESGRVDQINLDIESLSDSPEIGPGDVLVMRGDTIHRTQDTVTDRLAISIRCFDSHDIISKEKFFSGCEFKRTIIDNNIGVYKDLITAFDNSDSISIDDILPCIKMSKKS